MRGFNAHERGGGRSGSASIDKGNKAFYRPPVQRTDDQIYKPCRIQMQQSALGPWWGPGRRILLGNNEPLLILQVNS